MEDGYPARRSEAGRSAARPEEEGMRRCDILAPADWPCCLWLGGWWLDGRGDMMEMCLRLLIRPSQNA